MNIETPKINSSNDSTKSPKSYSINSGGASFSDNLKDLKQTTKSEEVADHSEEEKSVEKTKTNETSNENNNVENNENENKVEDAIDDLNSVLSELNQSDEKDDNSLKNLKENTDKNTEGAKLINNDFNIDKKDTLPQMNPNMNFGGDGQPFSSFMNDGNSGNNNANLSSSAKDLAEEAAILSTMAENIALANRANIESDSEAQLKTVMRNDAIKKIDISTGITEETVVKFDSVIMNEADVELFANLVQNGEVDLNNLAPAEAQKSVGVSKTLADMLAKAMQDNKPVRIEFDNGISVIIRISREGKLTADFLPSTQVAEAYLKENLPLLKQRFDEQDIEYDALNQRERKEQEKEQNRKKGQENE